MHTLDKLLILQEINEAINNPYGSTLNKQGKEIAELIEKNIEQASHKKHTLTPTQKELHYTLMDIQKELMDWYEWQPSDWHIVDKQENKLNDYQRVTLRNQKTGVSFETTIQNYSRSRQYKKYEQEKKQGVSFWNR